MNEEKPMMAQAFADSVGATKRQIQIWTDAKLLACLPGTDRQGRGRQRLYASSEKPVAALIARLAKFGIPIGKLEFYAFSFRGFLLHEINIGPVQRNRDWYRDALNGKHESWILMRVAVDGPPSSENPTSMGWVDREQLIESLKWDEAFIVVNVLKELTPHT